MAFVFRSDRKPILQSSANISSDMQYSQVKGFADQIIQRNQKKKLNEIEHRYINQEISKSQQMVQLIRQKNNSELEYLLINNDNSVFGNSSIKFNITTKKDEIPSSVFKSNTIREILPPSKTDTPGPGHYNIENQTTMDSRSKFLKSNLVGGNSPRSLYVNNLNESYQAVPSIPDYQKKFGYKTEDSKLVLNPDPFVKYSGIKEDRPGPTDYDVKLKKYLHGGDFHKSKLKRQIFNVKQNNQNQIVNEETYVTEVPYNYKCQNSSSFRTHIQQKPSLLSKSEKVLKKIFCKSSVTTKQSSQCQDLSSSEEQYIEDSTPGPGYYNIESKLLQKGFRSKKPELQKIFISKEEKIQEPKILNTLGPTTYNVKQLSSPSFKTNINAGFMFNDARFKEKALEYEASIGSYKPRTTLQYQLINKLLRGSKGRFGSNIQRFNQKQTKMPGPGQYDKQNQSLKKLNQEKGKLIPAYKSKVKRDIFKEYTKQRRPGPADYNQYLQKIDQFSELQQQLKPKRAPFLSTSKRFNEQSNLKQKEQEKISEILEKPKKTVNFSSYPFNSGSERFEPPNLIQTPAVGEYYDQQKAKKAWQIRSFNILFNTELQ